VYDWRGFSVVDRLTASMSSASPGWIANMENFNPAAINLLVETVMQNKKRGRNLEATFLMFAEEYKFNHATTASTTLVPAVIGNGNDKAASLIRELGEDRVRTRFYELCTDRSSPRPTYHINNNPVFYGLNMFEILFRMRHNAVKIRKANPILLCSLHPINCIRNKLQTSLWKNAEAILTILGEDRVFSPDGRPPT
jgi:hypothetical protein